MRTPTDWELVCLWERALSADGASRAIALLSAACPDEPRGLLERLPIGRRDVRLLRLRQVIFGADVRAFARCPACSEPAELSFDVAQLVRASSDGPGSPESSAAGGRDEACDAGDCVAVSSDGYDVVARLPDTRALAAAAAAAAGGAPAARAALFDACVVRSTRDGQQVPPGAIPAEVVARVARALEERDPGADMRVEVLCPACGHTWVERFDPVQFLWTELDAWAARALQDVHALARSYGWRERDILEMSAARRRVYLAMTGR
jgi:hypothetical protein